MRSPRNATITIALGLGLTALGTSLTVADTRGDLEADLAECLTLPSYGVPECAEELKARCSDTACGSDIDTQVAARLAAEQTCIAQSKTSACSVLADKEVRRKCVQDCHVARDRHLRGEAEQAQAGCERRFVEARGRGKFACGIPGADRSIDKAKLAAEFELALQSRDELAMDTVLQRSEHLFAAELEAQCTKACRKRGPTLLKTADEEARAASLLAAYDLCMVKADASDEARQLNAQKGDQYCVFLKQADSTCRRTKRCNWLEAHSELRCSYRSAATESCERD